MNRSKQLLVACFLYANDNDDRLAPNPWDPSLPGPAWVRGRLDWTLRTDNTSRTLLADSTSLLFKYASSLGIYRCPADRYVSSIQRQAGWNSRIRSMSMNDTMGTLPNDPNINVREWQSRTWSDIRTPSPSGRWVFIEEHPDSIEDGYFAFNPGADYWIELPASHHNGGCGLAFADGHSEIRKWRSATTIKPIRFKLWEGQRIPKNEQTDLL